MKAAVLALLLALASPLHAAPIPPEQIAPADAPSNSIVAGAGEPGERLVVSGRVTDGQAALAGVSIYVYQADAKGFYSPGGQNETADHAAVARLRGALRTDADGKFRYETIRPAAYGGAPAHVHEVLTASGFRARNIELMFEGDPAIPPNIASRYRNPDYVLAIKPAVRDATGIWQVTQEIALQRE